MRMRRPTQRAPERQSEQRKKPRESPKNAAVVYLQASCIGLLVVLVFVYVVVASRARKELRAKANWKQFNRCDLSTYPDWDVGSLRTLDLSQCGLAELPSERKVYTKFSRIKKLDVTGNNLSDLPQEMEELSNALEILFISNNRLSSLPRVIASLKKLRVFAIRGNRITDLNTEHLPSSSLVWLIATNNNIESVSPSLENLTRLRKLMLSHNALTSVPLLPQNVELVRLANNRITVDIPQEVLSLPKLAWIALSGNPVMSNKPGVKPVDGDKVVDRKDILFGDPLGHGASGTVYRAEYEGRNVAVKLFKPDITPGSDGTPEDEVSINAAINHPLAVSAIGVFRPSDLFEEMGMVMNLIEGSRSLGLVPSFDTVTRDAGPGTDSHALSKEQVLSIIWNVASVLDYIHGKLGICHGDVYLHNVMMDGQGVARLSDWGAAFAYNRSGSHAKLFERIEVLAFGRLVQDLFRWHLDVVIPDADRAQTRIGSRGGLDDGPFKELMKAILQPQPSHRPSFSDIKKNLLAMPEFAAAAKEEAEKVAKVR